MRKKTTTNWWWWWCVCVCVCACSVKSYLCAVSNPKQIIIFYMPLKLTSNVFVFQLFETINIDRRVLKLNGNVLLCYDQRKCLVSYLTSKLTLPSLGCGPWLVSLRGVVATSHRYNSNLPWQEALHIADDDQTQFRLPS